MNELLVLPDNYAGAFNERIAFLDKRFVATDDLLRVVYQLFVFLHEGVGIGGNVGKQGVYFIEVGLQLNYEFNIGRVNGGDAGIVVHVNSQVL